LVVYIVWPAWMMSALAVNIVVPVSLVTIIVSSLVCVELVGTAFGVQAKASAARERTTKNFFMELTDG
jgi:hypothetical protein